jgi:hypothetical protein
MPAYRFGSRKNIAAAKAQVKTYDINHYLPLIDRGAVTRFFSYKTQDEINAITTATGKKKVRVYEYDIQVHTRTDALLNGSFNMTLPTNADAKGYLIQTTNGTYAPLTPHATLKSFGQNVATIVVANHGNLPFTVSVDINKRPIVGTGSEGTVARALPANDDLIGLRIIEVLEEKDPGCDHKECIGKICEKVKDIVEKCKHKSCKDICDIANDILDELPGCSAGFGMGLFLLVPFFFRRK